MSRLFRVSLAFMILLQTLPTPFASAMEIPGHCEEGVQASGALYLICMPEEQEWNGDLVIYAHGYVAFNEPLELPDLELPDGTLIPDIVNGLGYAFATTSYRINGLAVLEGIEDVRDLVDVFSEIHGEPGFVYLGGGSEGGIITTLAVERFPEIFDGGLAACGPIGNFRQQINYWGGFRVVFDVFFPGLIPGSPVDIPEEVIENWESIYAPAIAEAIASDQEATDQLLNVTNAPIDKKDPGSVEETVLGLLWYNVFSTNDGIDKLGGQPFGNKRRIYIGSNNDLWLNRQVDRFMAERAALDEIEAHYQTSGELISSLVTLHTTNDPIVPYWHIFGYRKKIQESGSGQKFGNIPIFRYGHCEFKTYEVMAAFALLVIKVTGREIEGVERVLQDPEDFEKFLRLARTSGAIP